MNNLGKHLFKKRIVYYAIAQIDIDPPPLFVKWAILGTILIYPSSPLIEQFQIDETFFFIKVFPYWKPPLPLPAENFQ